MSRQDVIIAEALNFVARYYLQILNLSEFWGLLSAYMYLMGCAAVSALHLGKQGRGWKARQE
ncbi:hypothetical protein K437DRAFT_258258 [Tilletiaria anomala UBC 951]|uniref:Uncharacterized protein n=1 Tax=Tilletiaria anomala (strain ATCC 24038 / CBS 436.72 / UBC 951) TaxID=1037660 RepID=A0A066VMC1_TILAU|nr:uncharacterized protein K437DRAFT_258258 [Tilletiaria anomala UBC 951]KDN41418.1 hypothetical protein K437DRAFT_258258 [Tilletiaria anomala UBC 951]